MTTSKTYLTMSSNQKNLQRLSVFMGFLQPNAHVTMVLTNAYRNHDICPFKPCRRIYLQRSDSIPSSSFQFELFPTSSVLSCHRTEALISYKMSEFRHGFRA
jgi:hypothetical protein